MNNLEWLSFCTEVLTVELKFFVKAVIRVHFGHIISTEYRCFEQICNISFDDSTFGNYAQNVNKNALIVGEQTLVVHENNQRAQKDTYC